MRDINKIEPVNNILVMLVSVFVTAILCSFSSFANNEEGNDINEAIESAIKAKNFAQSKVTKKAKSSPYVIETLVQGSQEQPNVIYITPWQENEKAINIQGQSLQISLPKLMPVNPKTFNKKLHDFHQTNTVK